MHYNNNSAPSLWTGPIQQNNDTSASCTTLRHHTACGAASSCQRVWKATGHPRQAHTQYTLYSHTTSTPVCSSAKHSYNKNIFVCCAGGTLLHTCAAAQAATTPRYPLFCHDATPLACCSRGAATDCNCHPSTLKQPTRLQLPGNRSQSTQSQQADHTAAAGVVPATVPAGTPAAASAAAFLPEGTLAGTPTAAPAAAFLPEAAPARACCYFRCCSLLQRHLLAGTPAAAAAGLLHAGAWETDKAPLAAAAAGLLPASTCACRNSCCCCCCLMPAYFLRVPGKLMKPPPLLLPLLLSLLREVCRGRRHTRG